MKQEAKSTRREFLSKAIFWFALVVIELIHLKFLYDGGTILAGGDSYSHLQLARFKLYPYVWDIYAPFGSPGFITPNLLGFQLYSQLFGFLGTATLQRVMFFFLYFLKFVAFTKLASLFKPRFSWFALFPAILLLTYNAFASLNPIGYYALLYGIYLPSSLYYFIKFFESKKLDLVNLSKLILLAIIFSPVNSNPALSVTIFIPMALYSLLNLPRINRITILNLFLYGFFLILVSLWWVIPLLAYFKAISANVFASGSWFNATNAGTYFHNFRFIGQWAWYGAHFLQFYYPYSKYYDHPLIILISYLVIITAFYQAFVSRKVDIKKHQRVYLALLLVVSLLLISGTRAPLGGLYQFFFDHLPGFKIFREPFTKFGEIYTLTIAILFYLFLFKLETYLKGGRKVIAFSLITFLVVLITKPAFFGEHVPDHWNGSVRTLRVEIPQYWLDFEGYANENLRHSRIIATPNSSYGGAWNWPKGFSSGDDVSINFLYNDINVLRLPLPTGSYYDAILSDFYEDLQNRNPVDKYYSLMGVDYVLQENDYDWRYTANRLTPATANQILNLSVNPEKNFGLFTDEYLQTIPNEEPNEELRESLYGELKNLPALTLYKVPDHLHAPKIYSPAKVHFAELNRKNNYTSILADVNFQIGDIFTHPIENLPQLTPPKQVTFIKINPTKYHVSINNPAGPFLLQFTEQYNSNWKLIAENGQEIEATHILTNGFSNGWIIDSTSDIQLTIEYTPQRQFIIHLYLLTFILSVSLLIIIFDFLKNLSTSK